jgi:hypothetical protein
MYLCILLFCLEATLVATVALVEGFFWMSETKIQHFKTQKNSFALNFK